MTLEQKRALALAKARVRAQETLIPSGREPAYTQEDWDRLTYAPTVGMGTGERLAAGAGAGLSSLAQGVGQRLGLVSQKAVDETAALDKPLQDTTAGAAGRVAGVAVPLAATSIIPGANTVAGGAAVGALSGLAEPTQTGESVMGNVAKNTILGGAGNALARAIPTTTKALIDPLRQGGRELITGRTLNAAAGSNAPNIMQAARSPQQFVPGSSPNLAEATQDAGIAGFQLAASSASPEVKRQLAEQAQANTGARIAALRGIAGTPQEQAMNTATRDFMTEGFYRQAREAGIDPAMGQAMQPQIQNLIQRMPAGVMERAQELARLNGEVMGAQGSVNGLQWIKQGIDDLLGATPRGTPMHRALAQYKQDLMSTVEELSPAFAQANRNYATFSKPVNENQVGEYLLEKFQPALMDFSQGVPTRTRAEAYAAALRNAPGTIRNATGMRGFSELSDVMSPGGVQTATNVAQDLARSASAQDLAKTTGSTTAQNLAGQNLIRQFLGPLGMPQSFSERAAGSSLAQPVTRATNLVYGGAEQRIQQEIARALRDPAYAARLMEMARTPGVKNPELVKVLMGVQQAAAMTPLAIGMQ